MLNICSEYKNEINSKMVLKIHIMFSIFKLWCRKAHKQPLHVMWRCKVVQDHNKRQLSMETAGILSTLGLKSKDTKPQPGGWTPDNDIHNLCDQAAPIMQEALKNAQKKDPDQVIKAVIEAMKTENIVFQRVCQSHGVTGKSLDLAVQSLNAALLKRAKDDLQKEFDEEVKEIDSARKMYESGKSPVLR
jgi:hypothetical protein